MLTERVTNGFDEYAPELFILFIAAWLVGDTVTTIIGVHIGFGEASASIAWILAHGGYIGLVVAKVAGAVGIYVVHRYTGVWFRSVPAFVLGGLSAIVVVWNVVVIARYVLFLG